MRFPCTETVEIRAQGESADDRKREIVHPVGYFYDSGVFVGLFLESADDSFHKLLHRRAEEIKSAAVE